MGAKGTFFAIGLSILCCATLIVAAFFPYWAHKRFMVLGGVFRMDLEVSLVSVHTYSALCQQHKLNFAERAFCSTFMMHGSIQDVRDTSCASVMNLWFDIGDEKCYTFSRLFWCSVALMFAIFFHVVTSLIGCFFAFHFQSSGKAKGRYKQSYHTSAALFFCLGPIFTIICLAFWGWYTSYLGKIYIDWAHGALANSSDDPGVSVCWAFSLMASIFQLVAACILCATPEKRQDDWEAERYGAIDDGHRKKGRKGHFLEDERSGIPPPPFPGQYAPPSPWGHGGAPPSPGYGYPQQGPGGYVAPAPGGPGGWGPQQGGYAPQPQQYGQQQQYAYPSPRR